MKTVLVTRPEHQAASFVKELKQYGLNSFVFPTIEIRPVSGWKVPDLTRFDGIFFTSANSISFFMERLLLESPEELENLKQLKVWAVGKTTSKELLARGIRTQPVPKISDAVTLMEEIGAEAIAGKTFLFVRGSLSLGIIPAVISKHGGTCTEITVYDNIKPSREASASVEKMLQEGRLDCLSFTSPSTAENFFEAIGTTSLPKDVLLAAIGTTTATALEKLGLHADIIPESFDAPSFAKAIAQALA
ncbi:MAG: uroporphyrinogen-III synthase [Chlorobiaceae bacterium]